MKINKQNKTIKKLLSSVLTASIIATSFASIVQASAQTTGENSNQAVVETQTAANPDEAIKKIVISNKDDLSKFMSTSEYWGSNYKITLACDIDMKGITLSPIKEFNGKFDGCGHTISNLKIQTGSKKDTNVEVAFIQTLNNSAQIKNVTFNNYVIDSKSKNIQAAGLVVTNHGNISGVNIKNGTIKKGAGFVYNENEEDKEKEKNSSETIVAIQGITGGFVNNNSGIIENCSYDGDVYGCNIAGGFVGINDDKGEISLCKFKGNLESSFTMKPSEKILTFINCGGFVGINKGKIEDCTSEGKVDGCLSRNIIKDVFTKKKKKFIYLGIALMIAAIICVPMGIVIGLSVACSICLTAAVVVIFMTTVTAAEIAAEHSSCMSTNNQVCVGSFCGVNLGEINGCNANISKLTSKTSAKRQNICGGFIGTNCGTIKDSHVTGNEIGNKNCDLIGGFVGINSGKIEEGITNMSVTDGKCTGGFCGTNSGEIISSDSKGNVAGEEYVGGFAGVNKSEISDCNATGKATADAKKNNALAGGFVGENEKGTISKCEAKGGAIALSGIGQAKSGGFVGINKANIVDSKASGYVYLCAGIGRTNDGCGGFVGKNDQGGKIYNKCYAECKVETYFCNKGGGFVGEAKDNSEIHDSSCKTKRVSIFKKTKKASFWQHKDKKAIIENCYAN